MKLIPILAVALLATSAYAKEMYATNGQDSVWISDQKCSNAKVLEHLPKKYHDLMLEARAQVGKDVFRACWIVDGESAHLLYEDGDQGLVPLKDFKPAKTL